MTSTIHRARKTDKVSSEESTHELIQEPALRPDLDTNDGGRTR